MILKKPFLDWNLALLAFVMTLLPPTVKQAEMRREDAGCCISYGHVGQHQLMNDFEEEER